jgi:hypothetical protein
LAGFESTKISVRLQLKERDMIGGYEEYLTKNMVPEKLLPLKHTLQHYSYFFE